MNQLSHSESEKIRENSSNMMRAPGKQEASKLSHTIHREKCYDHFGCEEGRDEEERSAETMPRRGHYTRSAGPLYQNAIRYSSFMIKDILAKSAFPLDLPAPCPLRSRWPCAPSFSPDNAESRSHAASSSLSCNPSQFYTSPPFSSRQVVTPPHPSSPATSIANTLLHFSGGRGNCSPGEAAINTCSLHTHHSPPTRLTHNSLLRSLPHSLVHLSAPASSSLASGALSCGEYGHTLQRAPFDGHSASSPAAGHLAGSRQSPVTFSSSSFRHFYSANSSPGESSARTTSSNASESILICETDSVSTTPVSISASGGVTSTNGQIACNRSEKGNHDASPHSCASSTCVSPHHAACLDGLKRRKMRRNRTVFTELQLMGLERRFDSQKYLSTPDRADLARVLGLTQLQVKTWYQNRRMKWKKQVMQGGCTVAPTKPKGRPKKNSIPSLGILDSMVLLASVAASSSPSSTRDKCCSGARPLSVSSPGGASRTGKSVITGDDEERHQLTLAKQAPHHSSHSVSQLVCHLTSSSCSPSSSSSASSPSSTSPCHHHQQAEQSSK